MTDTKHSRTVFFVSDRTGLTAQSYGNSLLAQFPEYEFECIRHAFVDTPEQARLIAEVIDARAKSDSRSPIVFSTLVDPQSQQLLERAECCMINLFGTFIGPLEDCLQSESAHTLGRSISAFGENGYDRRLDAIDFALNHDDGIRPDQYSQADIILVGVSRCGKTPTSLFLAMNYSMKAANYPLTEEDLDSEQLPSVLLEHRSRLVGLTIAPLQLSNIREKRRPGSAYASLPYCRREVKIAESMFQRHELAYFDTTTTSIEELAGSVIKVIREHEESVT